jgi:hypothetical protein
VAEKMIASLFQCKTPLHPERILWPALYGAFKREDATFFADVSAASFQWKGQKHTWDSVRAHDHEWGHLYQLHDRFTGFWQWQTPPNKGETPEITLTRQKEGLTVFLRSLEEDEAVFQSTLSATLSPSMVRAFEVPAFLTALEDTVLPSGFSFFKALEAYPRRHPEWEAVLERRLLQTLTKKPDFHALHENQLRVTAY